MSYMAAIVADLISALCTGTNLDIAATDQNRPQKAQALRRAATTNATARTAAGGAAMKQLQVGDRVKIVDGDGAGGAAAHCLAAGYPTT